MEVEIVDILRFIHVIGAMVLMGTGTGIAFFMLMAHRSHDAAFIAQTASVVVIADTLFTATAAVFQPITGLWLAHEIGWPVTEGWVALLLMLYVFIGIFWLPVVWIQIQLRNMAKEAASTDQPLPKRYYKLFHIWFACGIPAFAAMLAIIWFMLMRPDMAIF